MNGFEELFTYSLQTSISKQTKRELVQRFIVKSLTRYGKATTSSNWGVHFSSKSRWPFYTDPNSTEFCHMFGCEPDL